MNHKSVFQYVELRRTERKMINLPNDQKSEKRRLGSVTDSSLSLEKQSAQAKACSS
jgi:hypothetical protein